MTGCPTLGRVFGFVEEQTSGGDKAAKESFFNGGKGSTTD